MDIPKYAKLEHERRFLVLDPPDLTEAPVWLIEDVYLDCGRLRLRRITHFDGRATEFKLCKKYDSPDPLSSPIVNIYLTAEEHAALSTLTGRPVRKRRHRVTHAARGFAVDVFAGELNGLVLAEAEAETVEAVRAFVFPPWAAAEVTDDGFFTGGHLARSTFEELAARLAHYRAVLPGARA